MANAILKERKFYISLTQIILTIIEKNKTMIKLILW